MTEPFDGTTTVPSVVPHKVQVWIQIHRIPARYRTKDIITQLPSRVGEVLAVEMTVVPSEAGEFHRVRVSLDSLKPLTLFTPLTPEGQGRMFLQVKYEKMPCQCEHCGLLDHEYLECGTEFEDDDLQFGVWLEAVEAFWHPGTPGMRVIRTSERTPAAGGRGFGGYRGGRMNGAGRNSNAGRTTRRWKPKAPAEPTTNSSKKRSSLEAGITGGTDEELEDTSASPLKK
jgi:hypothetical protein